MVVLASDPSTYERNGFTPERAAGAFADFAEREQMPLATNVIERMPTTEPACRAVIATRLNAPEREQRVLRELRRARMENQLFDEQPVIDAAAVRAGVTAADLNSWLADPRLDAAVAADMDAARRPSAASLQLDHKLANWEGGKRYTCPSYELEGPSGRIDVPGFNPFAVYETALANVSPELERRDDPGTVEEVLAWADQPLATKEVAVLLDTDLVPAREQLQAHAPVRGRRHEEKFQRGRALARLIHRRHGDKGRFVRNHRARVRAHVHERARLLRRGAEAHAVIRHVLLWRVRVPCHRRARRERAHEREQAEHGEQHKQPLHGPDALASAHSGLLSPCSNSPLSAS